MKKQTLRPSPTAILNPRLDVNFKTLFTQGTKESDTALQSFISAAIGRKIKSLKLDPNEPAVDTPSQMQMSFDVAVTFDDGEKADIEIQGREYEYDYAVRSEIQAARLLNNNAKKGCKWQANKVYQISVLNFHFKNGDKSEMSWYTMKDDESKTEYISKIAKSEEGIMEADRIAQRMSEEDINWFRQNSIDIGRRDYYSGIAAAKEKGIAKGIQQKAVEDARNALAMNLTAEQAAQITGLPLEQVLELQKEMAAEPAN